MMATLVAAALGIGAHRLATLSGNRGEPILIALFVFVEGTLYLILYTDDILDYLIYLCSMQFNLIIYMFHVGFEFGAAAIVTFLRFIPQMKARYDYGLLIFNLTFCLISVSGYRDDDVIRMGFERACTIIIGSSTAVAVCVFIRPVWIGVELHNQIAANMEKIANFLEGTSIYLAITYQSVHVTNTRNMYNKKSRTYIYTCKSCDLCI